VTDQELLAAWYLWLGVAALIVVVAATLLVLVLLAAKRIERGAGAALGLVKQIRANTQVIWALQDTNAVARELSGGAEAILDNAGKIAEALHEADQRRRRSAA
jgi:hypothetical protein